MRVEYLLGWLQVYLVLYVETLLLVIYCEGNCSGIVEIRVEVPQVGHDIILECRALAVADGVRLGSFCAEEENF